MTTVHIVLLILLFYAVAMLVVGIFANRRIGSFHDAIAAPGQASLLLLVGSAVAGQIGSGFLIGGAEYGARYGLGGAWYGIGCGLSYLLTACLCQFIRRNRLISLPDYFAQRYSGKSTGLIYSVASAASAVAMLGGQLLAARAIFLTLGLPAQWGVVLCAGAALVYTNASGLLGSMMMSTIQTVVISLGVIAAAVILVRSSGTQVLVEHLPAAYFHPVPFSAEFLVATAIPIIFAGPVNQISFLNIASAKSGGDAARGYLIAGLLLIPIAMIPPLLGMYGHLLFPGRAAEEVFIALLLERLPVVVAAVILCAILCAVVLSCSVCYIVVATNFVHSLYRGMVSPDSDDRTCRRLMLLSNLAACLLGIALALNMGDIIQVLSIGYGLMAAGCLVPFLGGILWKGGTGTGALISAFVGMGSLLADFLGLIYLPFPSVSSIALAAAAFVLGSRLTRTPEAQRYKAGASAPDTAESQAHLAQSNPAGTPEGKGESPPVEAP